MAFSQDFWEDKTSSNGKMPCVLILLFLSYLRQFQMPWQDITILTHGSTKQSSLLGSVDSMIPLLMAMILPHHGELSHQLVVWSPPCQQVVLLPHCLSAAVTDVPECGDKVAHLDCSQHLGFRRVGQCIDTFGSMPSQKHSWCSSGNDEMKWQTARPDNTANIGWTSFPSRFHGLTANQTNNNQFNIGHCSLKESWVWWTCRIKNNMLNAKLDE